MKQLFVASDGFIALNYKSSSAYTDAVVFVTELFNQTVKVYTSVSEVAKSVDAIHKLGGNEKVGHFLELVFGDSGIIVLEEKKEDLKSAQNLLKKLKYSLDYSDALMLSVMQRNGIKDVFTFNKDIKNGNVVVWPK